MEWTRPGIRRHFDFQGKDKEGRKRYIISLQITNKDPERKIATVHLPFEQDGWSMEVPEELRQKVLVTGLTVQEGAEPWMCRTDLPSFEGEQKGLLFVYGGYNLYEDWRSCLETGETAAITFEALVTSDKPLADQTLTLRYFPDLGWRYSERKGIRQPILKPSPYYSSNLELEIGCLA